MFRFIPNEANLIWRLFNLVRLENEFWIAACPDYEFSYLPMDEREIVSIIRFQLFLAFLKKWIEYRILIKINRVI